MKKGLLMLLLFFCLQGLWAQDEDGRFTYLLTNMGEYLLIGQEPVFGETYSGTMSFSMDDNGDLVVRRNVNGQTQYCDYEWGYPMESYMTTLSITFILNNIQYTGNYLVIYDSWSSAINLMGTYFPTDENGEYMGHEALFLDFGF